MGLIKEIVRGATLISTVTGCTAGAIQPTPSETNTPEPTRTSVPVTFTPKVPPTEIPTATLTSTPKPELAETPPSSNYPEDDSGFSPWKEESQEAEELLRNLGVGDDIQALQSLIKEEFKRKGIPEESYEWVFSLNAQASLPGWAMMVRDKQTGQFYWPRITEGEEAGLREISGEMDKYLGRNGDFFDLEPLASPSGLGETEQVILEDKSGWFVVGLRSKEDGKVYGWYNAAASPEGEWFGTKIFKPGGAAKSYYLGDKWVAENRFGEVKWNWDENTKEWVEVKSELEQKGFLPDYREDRKLHKVEFTVPSDPRERKLQGVGWRIGYTQIVVDKDFVDREIEFFRLGYHGRRYDPSKEVPKKLAGETLVPDLNLNYPRAGDALEKVGAYIHAVNLGVVDPNIYEPEWYSKYLAYIEDNPDASYVIKGYLPVAGKPGTTQEQEIGKVDPTLPVTIYYLNPVTDEETTQKRVDRILGGDPRAPYRLPFFIRQVGYVGVFVEDGKLSIFMSDFLTGDGELIGDEVGYGGGVIYLAYQIAARESSMRSPIASTYPTPKGLLRTTVDLTFTKGFYSDPFIVLIKPKP